MSLDAVEHSGVAVTMTAAGAPVIHLRKRPFLARLWRSYKGYRGKPLYMDRWTSFRFAWRLARL